MQITNAQIFAHAHKLAKEIKAHWPQDSYRVCFAIALRDTYEQARKAEARKQLTKRERQMVAEAEQSLNSKRTQSPKSLTQAQAAIESCTKHANLVKDLDTALAAKLTAKAEELKKAWAAAADEANAFEAAFFGEAYRARQQARFDRQYRIDQLQRCNNQYV